MALFQPIAGNLSGSVAGNTYSHNKGGPYVRRRAVPTNPSSIRQTAVRTQMSTNSRAWNGLTDAQRAAWKSYATANPVLNRQGVSIRLTGIAMFNRINNVSQDSGTGAVTAAPTGVGPSSLITASISSNTGTTVTIAFTATPVGTVNRLAVWWSGPLRASQDPNRRQARLISYSALNAATALVVTLPAAISAGDVINFWLGKVDNKGRVSPLTKVRYTAS